MSLSPNFGVIDCGAHIGDGAIPIADALKQGGRADITVYAIDPSPQKCQFIRAMAALNGLENIKVLQCGLSDQDGDIYSHAADESWGDNTGGTRWHSISQEGQPVAKNQEKIEFARLDTLITRGAISHRIGYIHLDVEDMETQAIKGAMTMFSKDRPILSAETHKKEQQIEIQNILKPHGYELAGMLIANSIFIPS